MTNTFNNSRNSVKCAMFLGICPCVSAARKSNFRKYAVDF